MAGALVPASGRKTCDAVVVGGGAGGLTAALLLSHFGRRVLLVEKAPQIGGSLARFSRGGLEFDTGFHFSAGLQPRGLMHDMLAALGLPMPGPVISLDPACGQTLHLEQPRRTFEMPIGFAALRQYLADAFPGERAGLASVMDRMQAVCDRTRAMDLRTLGEGSAVLPEDTLSLRQVLCEEIADPTLRAMLGVFCMCHGTAPSAISFANHSRLSVPLYDTVARLEGGGRALAEAFQAALEGQGVQLCRGRTIASFGPIQDRTCRSLMLTTGERVEFADLIFTLHPRLVLDALPAEAVRPAFRDRVQDLTPSVGFFALFASVAPAAGDPDWCRRITSLVPDPELDRFFRPDYDGDGPLVVMGGDPSARRPDAQALHVLETTPVGQVAAWADSHWGSRSTDYLDYKRRRVARILERLDRWRPGLAARTRVLASATALTHRDYLHSPDGSAYGVAQRIGQFNLYGRLPVRNFLAAGQSAVLPGVVGTMLTSFTICRSLIGPAIFDAWMRQRLGD